MLLAVNDRPLALAELCRALSSDQRKVRNTLAVLTELGVVANAFPAPNYRFIALNRAFPAYPPLLRLLRVLERDCPQERLGKPPRTAERLALRGLNVVGSSELRNLDRLFHTPGRTRVLLYIAAADSTDVSDVCRTMGYDNISVWNVANHWQREGVIRSRILGRRRVLELDPAYSAATELRRFLNRLVVVTEEYAALANLSTRNPKTKRYVCDR